MTAKLTSIMSEYENLMQMNTSPEANSPVARETPVVGNFITEVEGVQMK